MLRTKSSGSIFLAKGLYGFGAYEMRLHIPKRPRYVTRYGHVQKYEHEESDTQQYETIKKQIARRVSPASTPEIHVVRCTRWYGLLHAGA